MDKSMIISIDAIEHGTDNIPLKRVIGQMSNPTREKVKELYGTIGVDIFEGKDKITILNDKKPKKLIDKFVNWLNNNRNYDYKEEDSLRSLVHKHACNNLCGNYEEIEEKFGKEGLRIANFYKVMG